MTDEGFETTHDDPTHAAAAHATKEAAMHKLAGSVVRFQGELAVVTFVYSPDVINVMMVNSLAAFENLVRNTEWKPLEPGFTAPVCPVFWRHGSGVQFVALVIGPVEPGDSFGLLVLSDGYVDLGKGPGVPIVVRNAVYGEGHLNWLYALDA